MADSRAENFSETSYGIVKRLQTIEAWTDRVAQRLGKPSLSILDFGCGTGDHVTYPLACLGHRVLGVDVHAASIQEASGKYRLPTLRFRRAEIDDLLKEDVRFDLIVCSEVLEHLREPQPFLEALGRLLHDRVPALQARGLKGTFYIIGEALGWGSGYMNASQVGALQAAGNELGNHSWSHPYLTSLSATQIAQEFNQTQTTLQGITGVTPTACAYTYGAYNATVQQVASGIFRTCRSTDGGVNTAAATPQYALRTYYVTTSTTASQIRAAADQAMANKSWVIFIHHGVGTVISTDDVTSSTFNAHLDQIVASGVTVLPVSSAYHELTGR